MPRYNGPWFLRELRLEFFSRLAFLSVPGYTPSLVLIFTPLVIILETPSEEHGLNCIVLPSFHASIPFFNLVSAAVIRPHACTSHGTDTFESGHRNFL